MEDEASKLGMLLTILLMIIGVSEDFLLKLTGTKNFEERFPIDQVMQKY